MFETKKTLIVVYKDELVMNQLKKMIETSDDENDGVIGTRDNSINIVSWTEKIWLENKKAGNIQGKILFLGDIKGTDKLVPVIDVKFDQNGVKYGWAGNQAIIHVETKALVEREDYDAFLEELAEMPVPEFLKEAVEIVSDVEPSLEKTEKFEETLDAAINKIADNDEEDKGKAGPRFLKVLRAAKRVAVAGAGVLENVGDRVAEKSEEVFRNRPMMKRQMLFYGVIKMYNNDLEEFMNL